MARHQIIETPSGERLVVLPIGDYERLVAAAQDAGDARAYDEAKARLAAGEDEMLPSAMVNEILGGGNPIRIWRTHRGMSIEDLAARTGISAAHLSEIERNGTSCSIAVVKAIAGALDVSIDDLV